MASQYAENIKRIDGNVEKILDAMNGPKGVQVRIDRNTRTVSILTPIVLINAVITLYLLGERIFALVPILAKFI